ncbi:MAG: hypothetical protein WBD96_15720, partial [Pseudolabrys sp.]
MAKAKAKAVGPGPRSSSDRASKVSRPQEQSKQLYERQPELQLIYDTAPVGLAYLTPDCRYVQI